MPRTRGAAAARSSIANRMPAPSRRKPAGESNRAGRCLTAAKRRACANERETPAGCYRKRLASVTVAVPAKATATIAIRARSIRRLRLRLVIFL